jgi:hypothetical protein
MTERRRLLNRSSENISQLIHLALLHEENIAQEYQRENRQIITSRHTNSNSNNRHRNYRNIFSTYEIDITDLLERFIDVSYNINNEVFDSSSISHLITYSSFENLEDPINRSCPISHEEFQPTDEVIMINSCKHIFKKASLLTWFNRNRTCPCCRTILG